MAVLATRYSGARQARFLSQRPVPLFVTSPKRLAVLTARLKRLGCPPMKERLREPRRIPVLSSCDLEKRLSARGLDKDLISIFRLYYQWDFDRLLPDVCRSQVIVALYDNVCFLEWIDGEAVFLALEAFVNDFFASFPSLRGRSQQSEMPRKNSALQIGARRNPDMDAQTADRRMSRRAMLTPGRSAGPPVGES
jgi:hypothetical protein